MFRLARAPFLFSLSISVPLCALASVPLAATDVSTRQERTLQKRLQALAREGNAIGLYGLIEELAELGGPRAVRLIPAAAAALPSEKTWALAVRRLAELKEPASVDAVGALLDSRKASPAQKGLVLEAWARRDDQVTVRSITDALSSREPHVQISAARAAAERKLASAIPKLIGLLEAREKQRDRVWLETRRALGRLTGQEFAAIEDWKKFWAAAGDHFDPHAIGEAEGRTVLAHKPESVEFFGAEIFSANLIFLVDVSGSMLMYDEAEEYRGSDPERDRQRLRRAKIQLVRALKKLPHGARFNVIAYCDKVLPWKKSLQVRTSSSVTGAARFIAHFQARGATHTDEALEIAFTDPRVDTLVLLSDGAPEKRGRDSESLIKTILERVKNLNAARKITIETFGFQGVGEWPEKVPWRAGRRLPRPTPDQVRRFTEFLEELAAQSGGRFHAID